MSNNYSNFSEVLKAVIDAGGKEILRDKRKTNNYIEDLAPGNKFQKEKKLLNDAYSCNAVNILLDADTSPDRHKKAADSAKSKLIDSMSLSESGSELILKEICEALGWDTQQLFNSSSSQEKFQAAIPKGNKNVSLNKEYYNQPIVEAEPTYKNKPAVYSNQAPITAKAQTAKKKSPFGTVLKIAAVIIVVCVIYNLGKNDGSSDTVIIDETQATVSETMFSETYSETATATANTEAVTTVTTNNTNTTIAEPQPAYNENAAEAAIIISDQTTELTSETTTSITTTQEVTTSSDPRAEKYAITDIARFTLNENDYKFDIFMTYDKSENSVYYVTDKSNLHKFSLSDKSDNIILAGSEVGEKITGSSSKGNSLVNKDDDFSEFGIESVVFNPYNENVYAIVYGIENGSGYKKPFIYDIKGGNVIHFDISNYPTLSFINEDEFFVPFANYNRWMFYNMSTGDTKKISASRDFYRIVDINDNYYAIMSNGSVRKFSNIYNAECNELFSIELAGTDEMNNTLYYKDWKNNVYEIDLDNLTEEIYISVDDIFQNGKQFLGSDQCSGLYMTNDGGFITYDKSDNKLKYVSMYQ